MKKSLRGILKTAVSAICAAAIVASGLMHTGMGNLEVKAASSFDDLDQTEIVEAMGAGWNLGNQLEASVDGTPYETAWGNPTITQDLIDAVKTAGFDTVRIPVSYLNKIGSAPDYTIDSTWLDRVQEVVDMCIDNDMFVIINIHGDGYNSVSGSWLLCNGSDQTTIKAKYEAVWEQIANRFADYDEHLIFESMNEEFDGTYGTPNTTYYDNINDYNQIFVDTVRNTGSNNAKRWLLIPGWNTDIWYTAGDYGFELPTDNYRSSDISSNRIMISVHYYSPWEFCGNESSDVTQWGDSATDSSKVASWGDESYLQSAFSTMYQTFVANGYPVVIGEYGSIDKSEYDSVNTTCRAEFASKVCSYADSYGMIPVVWDNGYTGTYGFGLIDRTTYEVTEPEIIAAINAVYPSDNSDSSTDTFDSSKTYMIQNVNSGLYMDVTGAKKANGTNVIQYQASTAKANNTWTFVPDGNGYYYIYSCLGDGSTYLLDVANNSSASGTNIQIWENTYCDAQLYSLSQNSDGSYTILTKASGSEKCVEIADGSISNNANVQQWEVNGYSCQNWYLIATD
jgi:endoglucanase